MITHGHVLLNGRRVTVPGLMVEAMEEDSISYVEKSPFSDETHPVRQLLAGVAEEEQEEKAEDKKEEVEKNE